MDETLKWYFVLKTACGALRTVEWRCVVPPPVFIVPLRSSNRGMGIGSGEDIPVSFTKTRRFEKVKQTHFDHIHVAHFQEICE